MVYEAVCSSDGLLAKDIARMTGLDRKTVNRCLYLSPFMRELCFVDGEYRWYGLIRQRRPHQGLGDFCGWYGTAGEFMALSEDAWFEELLHGCREVGRNLNDTRGVLHSFRDCGETMRGLFRRISPALCRDWEVCFELKIRRARYIRIYADVLVITENKAFSLEFKMKDQIEESEVEQAAKYTPFLEVILGSHYDVIPALVLTRARELYDYVPLGSHGAELPVCSGEQLLALFQEYLDYDILISRSKA